MKLFKRSMCIFFALVFALTPLAVAANPNPDQLATRGMSETAIKKGLSAHNIEIMKGYGDGNMAADKPISRVEVLVMLSRALPALPETNINLTFSDLPDWARAEVSRLTVVGIVKGYSGTYLGSNDNITVRQLLTLVERAKPYANVREFDDFYQAVNAKFLREPIPEGYTSTSYMDKVFETVYISITKIITDSVASPKRTEKGSDQQRIGDFYNSWLDWTSRDAVGTTPLAPYLTAIENAQTLDQLMSAAAKIQTETGIATLFEFEIYEYSERDGIDVLFMGAVSPISKEYTSSSRNMAALETYLTRLFVASGKSSEVARESASLAGQAIEVITKRQLTGYEAYSGSTISVDSFSKNFKNIDMKSYINNIGLSHRDYLYFFQANSTADFSGYISADKLPQLKALVSANLLFEMGERIDKSSFKAFSTYYNTLHGTSGENSEYSMALNDVATLIPTPLERLYVENYFSAQAKANVTDMVKQVISTYKTRLQNNTWLSAETKTQAIKKLDAIDINIGYPDQWYDRTKAAAIVPAGNGKALIDNVIAVKKAAWSASVANSKAPSPMFSFGMNVYDVNAFYSGSDNSINFPAGILQDPFFSLDFKPEENYAKLGMVIAHEISHAFDSQGANYDADGRFKNWWTAQDKQNFVQKCTALRNQYHDYVLEHDAVVDGDYILQEAVADLGAIACTLDMCKQLPEYDLNLFFQSYARVWREKTTLEALISTVKSDNHPVSKLRINITLQNFDDFHSTYNVGPNHGMYLAPADRVVIW